MAKQKKSAHKKRHGKHHKKTKRYNSSYWPYIPVLLLIIGTFFFASLRSPSHTGVLAFATEMSPSSLLRGTNTERARNDRQPLEINQTLSRAAQAKAEDMARRNYWSHTTPDGEQPWVFIDEVDYEYVKAGENLAYGFLTSDQTIKGWMNSPTHRDNMLDERFREVGFGFVNAQNYQNTDAQTIVVAMYAQPVASTSASQPQADEPAAEPVTSQEAIISMEVPDANPEVQAVTRIESLVGGRFAWATFGIGILSGGAASGMLISHGIRMRKFLQKGGDFIMHHPMLDICLVSLLLLTAFLSDKVGYII